MTAGPEFFQTIMGRKFYEADVPRAVRALERIADALEKSNVATDLAAQEEVILAAMFTMREACADEAYARWGAEAATVIREVPLPGVEVTDAPAD